MLARLKQAVGEWVAFVPCDVPNLSATLVEELWRQKGHALAVYAHDGERDHPTLALLHTSLAPQLADYLVRKERNLMLFLQNVDARPVAFAGQQAALHNLNTPEDYRRWQLESELRDK